MQIHKKLTDFTPGGIQYMESLWIAYCRIAYEKKGKKGNSGNGTSENTDGKEENNNDGNDKNNNDNNDKNYDYRFQSFNRNIPEENKNTEAKLKYITDEFKNGILGSQPAKDKRNIDIVCIMNVKRKRTTGIKNEFLEIEVWDCQVYEEDENKRRNETLSVITTDISSLGKDIEEIALMGSGITRNGFRTVSKIIEVNYPLIKPETTTGWGKSGHKSREQALSSSILYFYDIYTDNISSTQKETVKSDKNNILIKDGYFYIPVNKFTEIYSGMDIQEYLDIKDYKKYLKDNGYIKTNKDRYDYTDAQAGKCIAFKIKKLMDYSQQDAKKDGHITEAG